jgi:hypothetical protein
MAATRGATRTGQPVSPLSRLELERGNARPTKYRRVSLRRCKGAGLSTRGCPVRTLNNSTGMPPAGIYAPLRIGNSAGMGTSFCSDTLGNVVSVAWLASVLVRGPRTISLAARQKANRVQSNSLVHRP